MKWLLLLALAVSCARPRLPDPVRIIWDACKDFCASGWEQQEPVRVEVKGMSSTCYRHDAPEET